MTCTDNDFSVMTPNVQERIDLHPEIDDFNTNRVQSVCISKLNKDAEPIGILDSNRQSAPRQQEADCMEDLMTTREVADFIGVKRSAVVNWRNRKLFGCYFFAADEKRGDTWYYYRERVEQLKAVYQKGVLQDMYKLAWLNSEADLDYFQKAVSSSCTGENSDSFQKPVSTLQPKILPCHGSYYSTEQVAEMFNVTVQAVQKWVKENRLRWDRYDHHEKWLFKKETIEEFKAHRDKKKNIAVDTQERTIEAEKFFNLLYGNVTERRFGYLWAKQGDNKVTTSFDVSTPNNRLSMAVKAIELSDKGFDVYYGINLTDTPLASGERAKHDTVSLQTATVTDIDIEGGTHISNDKKKYPPDFDTAKSFLPFTPSILINSGYGLHALCIYSTPLTITNDNREEAKARNEKFIGVIRNLAGEYSKAVDSVGDLPRVLRVPGTYNYKCGSDNAPLCHIVEANDVRFSPADMDDRLTLSTPDIQPDILATSARKNHKTQQGDFIDDSDFNLYRARRMLEFISPATLTYDDWFAIGAALKNVGCDCSDWEQWSRADERFKDGECEQKWNGFNREGYDIGTLYHFAEIGGYDAKEIYREWYQLHPESKISLRADFHNPIDFSGTSSAMNDDTRENFSGTQDEIKSCPVNLRLSPYFTFSQGGIFLVVETKKGIKYIPVTKTPIIPTKIFREPKQNKVTYEIAMLIRGKWCTTEIDGRTIADTRAILELADIGALILDAKNLCRYMNEIISLNPDLQEVKAYNQTGWIDNEFKAFAYPRNEACIVRRVDFDFDRILATRGACEDWKQKFIEVADRGGAIVHAYIGIGLSAILARPLNIMNPQAHLFGASGCGKTALQKFVASTFGNPREYVRSFAATNKNRQLVAAAFCDLPTFFDEMETMSGKLAEETLATDIYNFADGKGNQANKRDGKARKTYIFGGARLTTGERPILKQRDLRGAYKRLLQFNLREKIFDDNFATELHIFSESNFGHYGLQWINYATTHMEAIQKDYNLFATERNVTLFAYEPTHLKIIVAGLVAFEHFKIAIGVNKEFDTAEFIRDRRFIVDTQLPTLDELDDCTRAVSFLKDFFAGHEKFFINEVNRPDFDNEFVQTAPICYGKKFKSGEVAFLRTALIQILEKEGGFKSGEKLIDDFFDKGYLRHAKNTKTFSTYFNGKTISMIRFVEGIITTADEFANNMNTADN